MTIGTTGCHYGIIHNNQKAAISHHDLRAPASVGSTQFFLKVKIWASCGYQRKVQEPLIFKTLIDVLGRLNRGVHPRNLRNFYVSCVTVFDPSDFALLSTDIAIAIAMNCQEVLLWLLIMRSKRLSGIIINLV